MLHTRHPSPPREASPPRRARYNKRENPITRMALVILLGALAAAAGGAPAADAAAVSNALKAMRASAPSKTIRALAAGRVQLIVCYGTSLTYGGAWVSQLDRELQRWFPCRALLLNAGVGGRASPGGLFDLDRRVLRTQPDCVFLEFGINDAFEGYQIPVGACRSNLVTMIDRILAVNPACEIILMTMNPVTGKPRAVRPNLEAYYQVYRDVAAERGLMLMDHHANWSRVLAEDPPLFERFVPDGLHPAALGYTIVVTPAILAALGLGGGGFEASWQAYRRSATPLRAALPPDIAVQPRPDPTAPPGKGVR